MGFDSISSKWLTRLESSRFGLSFISFSNYDSVQHLNSEWPREILKFDLNFIFGQAKFRGFVDLFIDGLNDL